MQECTRGTRTLTASKRRRDFAVKGRTMPQSRNRDHHLNRPTAQGVLPPAFSDGAEGGSRRRGRQDGCGWSEINIVECGGRGDLLELRFERILAA